MGNLPTNQVGQLCKNQKSGSALDLIILRPSSDFAQIGEPDFWSLQPDFMIYFPVEIAQPDFWLAIWI